MYLAYTIITIALLAAYSLLILQYRKWYLRLTEMQVDVSLAPQTSFSIIIPARNEAGNIETCLRSVFRQHFPPGLFEVIVVNDYSSDETASIVQSLRKEYSNLTLLNLSEHLQGERLNAYKKKAIEWAVTKSKGRWIITTDADCVVQQEWLTCFDQYIQKNRPVFVAAPVMLKNDGKLLSVFQLLDFISLQGITAASVSAGYHSMCNGANLAYEKEAFETVGGFSGIDDLASGDDMLLMHKIKSRYPGRLGYLFSRKSIVTTAPMPDWKSFLNQRIRWASKADRYQDAGIFWTLALVYALNIFLLLLLPISLLLDVSLKNLLLLLLLKVMVELSLMIPVSRFYKQSKTVINWFLWMQPFHILYTVIAGWLGKFGSYQWKGRSVR